MIFRFFTILLFTFYLVADGPRFRRLICSFLRPDRQREVLANWEVAIQKTGGYLYSRLLLGIIQAVGHYIAFVVIGVPYPLALALFVGVVSQFVPVVGTYIANGFPALIALSIDPVKALWVVVFAIVFQQVENYFAAPRITARTMSLHPAVAFGSVLAGVGLFGPIGAIIALPAAAVFQAIGSAYFERHEVVESHMTAEPTRRRTWWRRWRRAVDRPTIAPDGGDDRDRAPPPRPVTWWRSTVLAGEPPTSPHTERGAHDGHRQPGVEREGLRQGDGCRHPPGWAAPGRPRPVAPAAPPSQPGHRPAARPAPPFETTGDTGP